MNFRQTPDAKRIVVLAAALLSPMALLATSESARAALVTQLTGLQTIDYSASPSSGTFAIGVSGDTIVGGYYHPAASNHGFSYSGSTYAPFDVAGASSTIVSGVSGNQKVGSYTDAGGTHGFLYDPSAPTPFKPLNYPGLPSPYTVATGIDGNNIVGYVNTASGIHGFLYDSSKPVADALAWTMPISPPAGSQLDVAHGISGSEIVGYYLSADNHLYGFMQSVSLPGGGASLAGGSSSILASFTTLDFPDSISTAAYGISGNNVVGDYQDSAGTYHGFLYNGANWSTLDVQLPNGSSAGQAGGSAVPGTVTGTKAYGISGNMVVGEYLDGAGINHGFEAQVPEPSTALLLAIGAALVAIVRRRRRSAL